MEEVNGGRDDIISEPVFEVVIGPPLQKAFSVVCDADIVPILLGLWSVVVECRF